MNERLISLDFPIGSSDGGATSVCGGNLSDSTAEGVPPTMDAYDTDATSLVSSAHHIYQRKFLLIYYKITGFFSSLPLSNLRALSHFSAPQKPLK